MDWIGFYKIKGADFNKLLVDNQRYLTDYEKLQLRQIFDQVLIFHN